ncbi:FHA domain-containing protein [Tautonia sociabilis]|uniref:FHA domain-containing protein n=1 Tax=Tautonia sociabilis TaxID=2080755 RepID=A0A432MEV3_9BACT|nr:FHA domain-containing protein [Tautonia sociabilis]RUL84202.1 FHA domain-containing protein [Tautonia sociabilis]
MDLGSLGRFWGACGAVGPLRLRHACGPEAPDGSRELTQPFAVIGRDPKADLAIDRDEISRRHLYVQVLDGRIFWLDLGSRIGVSRGGVVSPSGWLAEGEPIGLGPCRVWPSVVFGRAGGEPANPLIDRGPPVLPDAELEFKGRPEGPARWRLGRVLTLVGRAADCRLKIPDDEISRFHCALIRTLDGLWAVDLLSREGIRVEGARVRFARIPDGSSLHVGRYRMTVRYRDASSSSVEAPAWSVSPLAADQLPAVPRPGVPPAATVVGRSPSWPTPPELDPFVSRFEQMQLQMFEQFHQAMMAMFQTFGAMHRDQMGQVREELDRIRDLTRELQSIQAPSPPPSMSGSRPASNSPPPPGARQERSTPPPSGPVEEPQRPAPGPEIHDLISRRIAQLHEERQGRWTRVLQLISGGTPTT